MGASLGQSATQYGQGFVRRGASLAIPDLWLQILYKKFRFEAEAAMIYGSLDNTSVTEGSTNYMNGADATNNGWKVRQFGLATQSEFRAIEDRLRVQFGFGWASGDPDLGSIAPTSSGLQPQLTTDRTYSEFQFHPDYRIDLILFLGQQVLTARAGRTTTSARPAGGVYDFTQRQKRQQTQKLGGGAAVDPGAARAEFYPDPRASWRTILGIELDGKLYFQVRRTGR